ncbi:exodeoxyribonuclease VII large subunit [Desulfotalea psychrophila]|uniref:Exodeoxyribonuclease 7 large subunit n=1 Tax=Desulfotalea psychrophila (strain LSv54 / DSM 12343) TaxID=177439 RepID=Q6ALV1_DESPS|nr:exodeoxyribonuclease VII large subunit [Desulfotalea psychrophila]CAG36674.1 probable exodeoxyribonuclease VII, large chain [Desulfotalea psychrophila LSv54]
MTFLKQPIYSVSEITGSIKTLLEGKFRFITIRGEISNLKTPYSGHSYFTLKDDKAQIRAVIFKNQKRYLLDPLQDGKQVICHGRISLYEPRGEYQIIVDSIEGDGAGQFRQEFEKIKKRLEERGYFAGSSKKNIPPYPEKIVIISSPTGAAIQDFLKIYQIRQSFTHLQILPVRVQGEQAAEEIAEAIRIANGLDNIDLIVLCRGGGSIEDLWAFNEIAVAEAIHASQLPVVTGVGHEVDFTIADFCADARAATPTGAAEMLLADSEELGRKIMAYGNRQRAILGGQISFYQQKLKRLTKSLSLIEYSVEQSSHHLELTISYFKQAMLSSMERREQKLQQGSERLKAEAPLHKIILQKQRVENLKHRLKRQIRHSLDEKKGQFSQQAALLNSVSPLATLSRGYAVARIISTGRKEIISNSTQVKEGQEINVLLGQGSLDCKIVKSNQD